MFPRSFAFAAAVCVPIAIASPSLADWDPGGTLVNVMGTTYPLFDAIITDLPNGDLLVLSIGHNSSTNAFCVQRMTHDGAVAPGWPANGVALATPSRSAVVEAQGFMVDDNQLLWRAWNYSGAHLEMVDGSGVHSPTSSPPYYSYSATLGGTSVAPATGGDAFVALGDASVVRVTSAGTTTDVQALPTGYGYDDAKLLADGNGGCYAFLRLSSTGNALLQRLDSNLDVASGWPSAGLSLSTVLNTYGHANSYSGLVPSGPDHVIAAWWDGVGNTPGAFRVQRAGSDGTLDPAWPAAGLEPFPADTAESLRLLPDGQDGVYVLRINSTRPAVTHISADGQIIGGPDAGILDANAQYLPNPFGSVEDPVNADVAPDGGLIVAWNDHRLGTTSFRVRWLNPDLSLKSGTPDEGVVVYPTATDVYHDVLVSLHSDGEGGAYLVWGVVYLDLAQESVWMTRVSPPVITGVGDPGPLARHLALSAPRPNPARGEVAIDLTLPADREARADLLDLAGRAVRTQAVAGAGRHSIRFDRLESLAPGLYFVRARSGTESSTVRFVLER